MQKHIVSVLALLTIALIFGSCTTQSDYNSYAALLEKSQTLNSYSVVYTMSMDALKGLLGSGAEMNIGVFKNNEQKKSVVEVSMLGQKQTMQLYSIGTKSVMCAEYMGATKCELYKSADGNDPFATTNMLELNKTLSQVGANVTKLGKNKIADRSCTEFAIVTTNASALATKSLVNYEKQTGKTLQVVKTVVCLDDKTGYPLYMNVSMPQTSELLGTTKDTPVMSMTAISFADNADGVNFKLPVTFSASNAGCNNDVLSVVVNPFQDLTESVSVVVNKSSYSSPGGMKTVTTKDFGTITFSAANAKRLDISIPTVTSDEATSFAYSVCIGGKCEVESCYKYLAANNCFLNSADEIACKSDTKCSWEDPMCTKFDCYNQKTSEACNLAPSCKWDASPYSNIISGYCSTKSCTDFTDANSCAAIDSLRCTWDTKNSYCKQVSCYDFSSQDTCLAKYSCAWKEYSGGYGGGYCSTVY